MCSYLTSALEGGNWSASRPGGLTPGGINLLYLLNRGLGGPQRWFSDLNLKINKTCTLQLSYFTAQKDTILIKAEYLSKV